MQISVFPPTARFFSELRLESMRHLKPMTHIFYSSHVGGVLVVFSQSFQKFLQSSLALIDVTCVENVFCCLQPCFKAGLFGLCCRYDGPAEGAAFRLPGHRGSYTSCPPQQQAGQPGTYLQAMEVEEKEEREAEALCK